ncbi:MAG: Arabinoxylan arabinofuranohydrolase [Phycisphaerae bacterium]|nr:Arabinoxylan arabinofuranohydrolase [Phycisphaerae bacterium]
MKTPAQKPPQRAARLAPHATTLVLASLGAILPACRASTPATSRAAPGALSGNPILPGWYADPEGAVIGGRYWIFPTTSARYDEQTYFDAFSSPDLVHWTCHPKILEKVSVSWARRAMWAPALAHHNGRYFLFFAANDIQSDSEPGGIGVAVADRPEGPFSDYLGKPLIAAFHNGAQPIDQCFFRDRDGRCYLIYGGWRHCNLTQLNADFTGFVPLPDGSTFKEVTPEGYVEGPFMFVRNGRYYFMWSEGGWTGPDYSVAYATADSVHGPFTRLGKILQQDPAVATGAGHHSVIQRPGADQYYIVYHRRPLGETDRDHRVVCIERLEFDERGFIKPVRMTTDGVEAVGARLNGP